jgi:RimJ/RimL family protein N-acetyltransferase
MPPIVLPDPPLSDGVITLRAFTADDIPAITAACQDPEIARWTAMVPSPYTEEDARGWIATHDEARREGLGCPFAVVDAGTGGLLASAGFHQIEWDDRSLDVGYWTAPWARRRGVATRAVRLLSGWAIRDLGMERISLLTFPGNVASEGVARSAGYTREGVLRAYLEVRGERRDTTVWSLIAADLDVEHPPSSDPGQGGVRPGAVHTAAERRTDEVRQTARRGSC